MLSQALTNPDLKLISDGILDACDALDGVKDGLVSNPAACKFDPAVLQCKGAKDAACLSAPQVAAVRKVFDGARDSSGKPLYFSWPYDPGVGHPDERARYRRS